MLLIVESGATKAEWALVHSKDVLRFRTPGINVAVMPAESVVRIVADAANAVSRANLVNATQDVEAPNAVKTAMDFIGTMDIDSASDASDANDVICNPDIKASFLIDRIRFYGAGLIGSEGVVILDKALRAAFPMADIAYGSDLLAAAKAGLGDIPGIVAILGTGSNSAFYDGHRIVSNVRPGGFILGDEGGGVSLGKAFAADFIKGLLPEELSGAFREKFSLTYASIVRNVYSGTNPTGYLASFVPFILDNRTYPQVDEMIRDNFLSFIRRCIMQYDYRNYPVAVIGAFGNACRDELIRLGVENGVKFCKFVPSPIDALVQDAIAKD
ncbi:MAG: hypothetical protein NC335_04325 [Bacteroides sp.]|nr:hypothetical protein [Bacteroides sp.]